MRLGWDEVEFARVATRETTRRGKIFWLCFCKRAVFGLCPACVLLMLVLVVILRAPDLVAGLMSRSCVDCAEDGCCASYTGRFATTNGGKPSRRVTLDDLFVLRS